MKNEIEFFGTNQKDAFLSMVNNVIACYNNLGGNLKPYSSIGDYYNSDKNKNSNLMELMSKCNVIIFDRGDPLSVPVFLKRVATGKIVGLGKPDGDAFSTLEESFLGFGHFRNGGVYTLDELELKGLNNYLKGFNSDFATTSFKYKNLIISSKLVKKGVTFPNSTHDGLHNRFSISVLNTSNDTMISFDYYGSTNDYNNGETEIKGEDLLQAFEHFISDGLSANEDFENWCGEFGYDSDSRTADKTYQAVDNEYLSLCSLFNEDEMQLMAEIN